MANFIGRIKRFPRNWQQNREPFFIYDRMEKRAHEIISCADYLKEEMLRKQYEIANRDFPNNESRIEAWENSRKPLPTIHRTYESGYKLLHEASVLRSMHFRNGMAFVAAILAVITALIKGWI